MKRTYVYRPGHRTKGGIPAETVAAVLERLRARDGSVRAEAVVAEAEPEESPVHAAFTWDDAEAGHRWRLIEARTMIRAIQVVVDKRAPEDAYIHIPRIVGAEGDYQPFEIVRQHVDMFTLALEEALTDLASAQRRVEGVRRLADGAPDRMATIALAAQALSTAESALRAIH